MAEDFGSTVGTNFPKVEWAGFERSQDPLWVGDFLDRNALLPGGSLIDPAQFLAYDAVKVTVSGAGAAQNATAIPLASPIPTGKSIPSGTLLSFGAGKYAKLTAEAVAGANSLAVEALPVAIPAASVATYAGVTGRVSIPSGTALGRTITERDANTPFGPAVDTDDEIYLLVFDIVDANNDPQCELYRHGRVVKENFLPDIATMAPALLTKLRGLYTMTKGVE
jgi:hypothetical protein